jgi:hypothetical protein
MIDDERESKREGRQPHYTHQSHAYEVVTIDDEELKKIVELENEANKIFTEILLKNAPFHEERDKLMKPRPDDYWKETIYQPPGTHDRHWRCEPFQTMQGLKLFQQQELKLLRELNAKYPGMDNQSRRKWWGEYKTRLSELDDHVKSLEKQQ